MKSWEFVTEDVSRPELDSLRMYLNDKFSYLDVDVSFTNHFLQRVNDVRNVKPITIGELTRLFREELKNYGKDFEELPHGTEAVLKDIATKINVPVAFNVDQDGDVDMVTKSAMRKKNFGTTSQEYIIS